jgi:anti-sigma regulatory factor (Ser/Thr protein kinase)
MVAHKHSFELKNDLSELKLLKQNLENFGRPNGLSNSCINEINIGLDELFTNIVSYGFKDDSDHRIRFNIHLKKDVLTINVEDDGIPFNPLEIKDPGTPTDLIDVKIGGLGIHFVKQLMDDVCYDRNQGKNRLTLIKSISAKVSNKHFR